MQVPAAIIATSSVASRGLYTFRGTRQSAETSCVDSRVDDEDALLEASADRILMTSPPQAGLPDGTTVKMKLCSAAWGHRPLIRQPSKIHIVFINHKMNPAVYGRAAVDVSAGIRKTYVAGRPC